MQDRPGTIHLHRCVCKMHPSSAEEEEGEEGEGDEVVEEVVEEEGGVEKTSLFCRWTNGKPAFKVC